jgi:hypothetical protein
MLASLALGAAACGGASPTRVASGSTDPSSASGATSAGGHAQASTDATGLLAYASCMRSHGVANFPDPDGSGQIPKQLVLPAARAVSDAKFRAAGDACSHLLPAGGLSGHDNLTITAQDQQDYLRAVACMRSHGFPTFPDPSFSGGRVSLQLPSSIDQNSAAFTRAAQTCRKLIPVGLPYSQ